MEPDGVEGSTGDPTGGGPQIELRLDGDLVRPPVGALPPNRRDDDDDDEGGGRVGLETMEVAVI